MLCMHVRIVASQKQLREYGVTDPKILKILLSSRAFQVETRKEDLYRLVDQITDRFIVILPESMVQNIMDPEQSAGYKKLVAL